MNKKSIVSIVSFSAKLLVGILVIMPILLGFSMSFLTAAQMATIPPTFIPKSFEFFNYEKALRAVPLFMFMSNSFIVCIIVITAQIITCSFSAYAFAFFDFPFKNLLFFAVLSTIMIPADATIIANYLTISTFKLTDTYVALVAPYLTSAMGIFLMRQYYLTIPKELREASVIDGCGHMKFLVSILTPLSKPVIASLSVYVFINTYNQFLWPLLVTNTQKMRTVQVGMNMLKMAEAVDYGIVLAGAVLILSPAIIVFVLGQKALISGMTSGALKG